jgi:hypothetical protein
MLAEIISIRVYAHLHTSRRDPVGASDVVKHFWSEDLPSYEFNVVPLTIAPVRYTISEWEIFLKNWIKNERSSSPPVVQDIQWLKSWYRRQNLTTTWTTLSAAPLESDSTRSTVNGIRWKDIYIILMIKRNVFLIQTH